MFRLVLKTHYRWL